MKRKKEDWRVEAGRLGGLRSGEVRRVKKAERLLAEELLNAKAPELLILRDIVKELWGKEISTVDIAKLFTSPRVQSIIESLKALKERSRRNPFK